MLSIAGRLVSISLPQRLDALSADVDLALDTVHRQAHALNIHVPASSGVTHGVTDVVTELWPLAANFTLGHTRPPVLARCPDIG